MAERGRDPIKKVELADGRTRYRFTVDIGRKPDGRRDQRTYTYDLLKEARTERARIISERAQGTLVRPNKKLTVAQVAEQFLDSKQGKKPGTVRSYIDALSQLVDRHGDMPIQTLDVDHLEKLKRDMMSGKARRLGEGPMAPRTVNLMLGVTSMMLAWARRRKLVTFNAAELVDRVEADPDAGADRGEWQTEDAVAFLKFLAPTARLYAAWFLALLGLRRGEVCGLRWDDVDLTGDKARARRLPDGTPSIGIVNNRTIVAGVVHEGTPKGKGRRRMKYLPLPSPLVEALRKLKARQAAERLAAGEAYGTCPLCGLAHVVCDELGAPYRPPRFSEQFDNLIVEAGLPPVTLHGMRHCAASMLGDLGFPDVVVAAWLGHTQITVTHGYQHAMRDRMRDAGKALGDILGA